LKKLLVIFFLIIALPITQIVFFATSDNEIPQVVDLHQTSSNFDNSLNLFSSKLKISSIYNAQDYIGLQESVWENGLTGNNVTVAVIDTVVDIKTMIHQPMVGCTIDLSFFDCLTINLVDLSTLVCNTCFTTVRNTI